MGPAQVPARGEGNADEADEAAQAEQGSHDHDGGEEEQCLHGRDEQVRPGVPEGRGHHGDVAGTAGGDLAGARSFHRGGREAEHPIDVPLAHAGEGALAESVRDPPGLAGQEELGHRGRDDAQRQPVHDVRAAPRPHLVDDAAHQPRAREPGPGRQRAQHDHRGDRAAVGPHQPQRGPACRARRGDGKGAHRETTAP